MSTTPSSQRPNSDCDPVSIGAQSPVTVAAKGRVARARERILPFFRLDEWRSRDRGARAWGGDRQVGVDVNGGHISSTAVLTGSVFRIELPRSAASTVERNEDDTMARMVVHRA